jgi:hypothetical protein
MGIGRNDERCVPWKSSVAETKHKGTQPATSNSRANPRSVGTLRILNEEMWMGTTGWLAVSRDRCTILIVDNEHFCLVNYRRPFTHLV